MLAILQSLGTFFIDLFKSRRRLEAENLFLGHPLSIALGRAPSRLRLTRWACGSEHGLNPTLERVNSLNHHVGEGFFNLALALARSVVSKPSLKDA